MAQKGFRISLDRLASKDALELMEKFPELMQKANRIALFRIGQDVRSDAGTLAPYKTGTLRRSLTNHNDNNAIFEQKRNFVEVGSNLVYARTQEFGRGNIPARFFLTKALNKQIRGEAEKTFSEEIDSMIK